MLTAGTTDGAKPANVHLNGKILDAGSEVGLGSGASSVQTGWAECCGAIIDVLSGNAPPDTRRAVGPRCRGDPSADEKVNNRKAA
jgi:hypothetical protein